MTNINETLKVTTALDGKTVITVTLVRGPARAVVNYRTTQSGIKENTAYARRVAQKNLDLMTEA